MSTHFVITAAWRDTVAKLLIVLIVCISLAGFSQAKTRCNQVTPILRQCTSEADFSRFSQSYASQRMSQWCWAGHRKRPAPPEPTAAVLATSDEWVPRPLSHVRQRTLPVRSPQRTKRRRRIPLLRFESRGGACGCLPRLRLRWWSRLCCC